MPDTGTRSGSRTFSRQGQTQDNPEARMKLTLAAATAMTVMLGVAAHAQSDPKACAPGAESHLKMPDTPTPQAPATPNATTGSGASLSDKLAKSDGVLCPPNVDPDIKVPTPDVGKMPVIPPPGSPGGNPNIQPK
jgi:hypothetical protein